MNKIDPIRTLEFLENDLDVLKSSKFHPKDQELINIVFNEDIPELIKFAKKVHEIFSLEAKSVTGDYNYGYEDCYLELKNRIYGK